MFRSFSIAVVLAASACLCSGADQQKGVTRKGPLTPADIASESPFVLEGKLPLSIAILPAGRMAAPDRELARSAKAEIRRRAALQGFDLSQGDWQQDELDCPAFPGHLLLRFERNRGPRDISMFSVSVPRSGGRIRMIPILRRGFAPYSAAPVNRATVAAFNQIRNEEHAQAKQEWAALGLCYAALAGAPSAEDHGAPAIQPTGTPILRISPDKTATMEMQIGAIHPANWHLDFSSTGVLLKAAQSPAQQIKVAVTPANPHPLVVHPAPLISQPGSGSTPQ